MQELWSSADTAALEGFTAAARAGDVFDALLAVEGAPAAAQAEARRTIGGWSRDVRGAMPGLEPVDALRAALGVQAGLNSPAALDPISGCQLTEVLRERRGHPLTVSAIWLTVGRRAGLRVRGVGLPGYFLVRIVSPRGPILVDPGRGGIVLTEADCRSLVAEMLGDRVAWRPEFLRAVSPAALLTRAINDLLNAHAQTGDARARYRAVRFLCALHPRTPAVHLLHARVAEEVGAVRLAGDLYEEVAGRFPGTNAAAAALRERSAIGELPSLH